MSDSVWPHRRQPTRIPRPWDSPGKNTGVGCHCLLQCVKVWRFLKKLKIELPYDPAIPLLGISPENIIIQKDICTPVFTVALFTIAKTWSNLNVHGQRNGWRCGTYTMENHSTIKTNNAICSNTDATRDYHTKWSRSNVMTSLICGI